MSASIYPKFKLSNPNKGLTSVGFLLLAVFIYSYFTDKMGIVIGIGILVKVLVLLWIPKAARLVGRNGIGWTIFAFLVPSVALILLGSIGYKPGKATDEFFSKCSNALESKQKELNEKLASGEISETELHQELDNYYVELQDFAKDSLNAIYDNENTEFLNEQLKRKGYILNDESDVFVEFEDKCPACNSPVSKEQKECPECGLNIE